MKKAALGAAVLVAGFGLFKLGKGFWAYMSWDEEDD